MIYALALTFLSFTADYDTTVVRAVEPTNFGMEGFMTNAKLERILKEKATIQKGDFGYWEVIYQNRYVLVITDNTNNRMRIISPVIAEKDLKGKDEMKKALEANFHSALDAKYAMYNGYIWSVFTHPLGELSSDQVEDALEQVVNLTYSFGKSYASTPMNFVK